jgi:hypothetical protein
MSVENAKKVLHYAVAHPSFRKSLANDPAAAIRNHANDLKLDAAGLSIDELDAIAEMTSEDFASLEKVAVGLGDDFSSESVGEHTGGVIL